MAAAAGGRALRLAVTPESDELDEFLKSVATCNLKLEADVKPNMLLGKLWKKLCTFLDGMQLQEADLLLRPCMEAPTVPWEHASHEKVRMRDVFELLPPGVAAQMRANADADTDVLKLRYSLSAPARRRLEALAQERGALAPAPAPVPVPLPAAVATAGATAAFDAAPLGDALAASAVDLAASKAVFSDAASPAFAAAVGSAAADEARPALNDVGTDDGAGSGAGSGAASVGGQGGAAADAIRRAGRPPPKANGPGALWRQKEVDRRKGDRLLSNTEKLCAPQPPPLGAASAAARPSLFDRIALAGRAPTLGPQATPSGSTAPTGLSARPVLPALGGAPRAASVWMAAGETSTDIYATDAGLAPLAHAPSPLSGMALLGATHALPREPSSSISLGGGSSGSVTPGPVDAALPQVALGIRALRPLSTALPKPVDALGSVAASVASERHSALEAPVSGIEVAVRSEIAARPDAANTGESATAAAGEPTQQQKTSFSGLGSRLVGTRKADLVSSSPAPAPAPCGHHEAGAGDAQGTGSDTGPAATAFDISLGAGCGGSTAVSAPWPPIGPELSMGAVEHLLLADEASQHGALAHVAPPARQAAAPAPLSRFQLRLAPSLVKPATLAVASATDDASEISAAQARASPDRAVAPPPAPPKADEVAQTELAKAAPADASCATAPLAVEASPSETRACASEQEESCPTDAAAAPVPASEPAAASVAAVAPVDAEAAAEEARAAAELAAAFESDEDEAWDDAFGKAPASVAAAATPLEVLQLAASSPQPSHTEHDDVAVARSRTPCHGATAVEEPKANVSIKMLSPEPPLVTPPALVASATAEPPTSMASAAAPTAAPAPGQPVAAHDLGSDDEDRPVLQVVAEWDRRDVDRAGAAVLPLPLTAKSEHGQAPSTSGLKRGRGEVTQVAAKHVRPDAAAPATNAPRRRPLSPLTQPLDHELDVALQSEGVERFLHPA